MTPHRRQDLLAVLVLAVSASCVTAQESVAVKSPRFEVASIKAGDGNAPHMMGIRVDPGGRVEIGGFPLKALVTTAFDLGFWQVSGGDAWVSNDIYFVEAKPPETLRTSIKTLRYTLFGIDDPILRQMLQALLIDRFQLKFHREIKTLDIYLLKRGEKELALNPARIPVGASESNLFGSVGYAGGEWSIFSTTMPQLARFASTNILHALVLDQTALSGSFDYRQRQPDLDPQYSGDQTSSFKGFLSAAGLKLERSKGPVEMFVIDNAARATPN